jgi:peptidyl-prolyl cis-trans isomerase C
VRIRKVEVPQPPKLADIRQRVENDWRAATAASREAKAYQALLDGYSITIEKP